MRCMYFILSALIVALDQASKYAIAHHLSPYQVVHVTSFFNLMLVYNTGIAFGLLTYLPSFVFILINSLIGLVIMIYLYRLPQHKRCLAFGLALIVGGALGNLWDRLSLGHVIDFLDFHLGSYHWAIFNVADAAVSVGTFLVIVDAFFYGKANRQ